MKKSILSIVISIASIFCCIPGIATAESGYEVITSVTTEYCEDGSYFTTTLIEYNDKSIATVKSGSKVIAYKNSDDVTQWTYTINGTFSYNGSTSSCTAVSDSYSISNSNWHIDSHSSWKSGNTAYGTVSMDYKILGITINTVTRNTSLSCSATGVLS